MSSSSVLSNKRKMESGAHTSVTSKRKMAHEMDLSGLSFSKMRVSDNGRKTVYVNMNSSRFQIESPWLTSSFGVRMPHSEYVDPAKPKYNIQLSLNDNNGTNHEVKEFVEFMTCFEKRLIQEGVKNSMEWFKKRAISKEVIEQAMFTKIVKPYVDKETGEESNLYAPTLTASIPYYNDEWNCMVFDENCKMITEDIDKIVTGRMKVRVILECCPMWFIGTTKYGCKWKVVQMQYIPVQGYTIPMDQYAFDSNIPRTFDASSVVFSDIKVSEKNGSKNVYINNAEGRPLLIETPWMTSFNGISLPPPEYSDPDKPKYTINWSMDGYDDSSSDVQAFYKALTEFDERILQEAKAHPMEWFRKKSVSVDVIKSAMFNPQVKFRIDKETGEERLDVPPICKASVPYYDHKWCCVAYDSEGDKHTENLDDIAGGQRMQMRAILQCKSVWFVSGRFGCGWKVVQLEFQNKCDESTREYAFRNESSETKMIQENDTDRTHTSESIDDTIHILAEASDECIDSDLED